MQYVVTAREVHKAFGPKRVLRGLSLNMQAQECVALMGPNGAGKTTLLNILSTLLAPDSGEVSYFGQPLRGNESTARRQLGVVSHTLMLYADLTVEENLRFYARMYAIPYSEDRIDTLLKLVNLNRQRNQGIRTLSRGMQQRLTIARALLHDPQILLLDEPFTGLDQMMAGAMQQLLLQLVQEGKKTILYTSHHFEEVEKLASRVLFLKSGKLVEECVPFEAEKTLAERYQSLFPTEKEQA